MSVGPRLPAFSESSVCGRRTPCVVVRKSLSCAGTLLERGTSTGRVVGRSAATSLALVEATALVVGFFLDVAMRILLCRARGVARVGS